MASLPHTNPRLLAQASHIPWAMSYLRFDYRRPPSRTSVLLRLLSALCPDVVKIIRGKPVLSTGVITTSVANAARKLQQHPRSTGVVGGEEKEACHAYMTRGRQSYISRTHRSICRGWCIHKCTSNRTNTINRKKSLCNTQVKRRGLCSKCTHTSTEQGNKVCADDWTEPLGGTTALSLLQRWVIGLLHLPSKKHERCPPACWRIPAEPATLRSAACSKLWGCKAPLWDTNTSFIWASECSSQN